MNDNASISWQLATVKDIRVENATVKTFTLSLSHWVAHLAGQYYDIRLTAPDGYQAQRSYSVASEPGQVGEIQLTIENLAEGEVSSFMHEVVEIGDQLEVRGPIGKYFVWQPKRKEPLLLVGGGSGVVPLMAILRHRAAVGAMNYTKLLYSVRSPEHLIYAEELRKMQQEGERLAIHLTYTRSIPEQWAGYQRRVDRAILEELLHTYPETPLAYLCGPDSFVEQVAVHLVNIGLPTASILTERFGPSGS